MLSIESLLLCDVAKKQDVPIETEPWVVEGTSWQFNIFEANLKVADLYLARLQDVEVLFIDA